MLFDPSKSALKDHHFQPFIANLLLYQSWHKLTINFTNLCNENEAVGNGNFQLVIITKSALLFKVAILPCFKELSPGKWIEQIVRW